MCAGFILREVRIIKRLKMQQQLLTLEQGCELYLQDCRYRNLREATIKHYQQSYKQLFKFFDTDMPLKQMTQDKYQGYIIYLSERLNNDVSINAYLRDLITTLRFLMSSEYLEPFKMQSIKVDKTAVKTYTEEELTTLLKKPNIKKCSFTEYECYVISCLLLTTGIRQHSLMELKISDVLSIDTTCLRYVIISFVDILSICISP